MSEFARNSDPVTSHEAAESLNLPELEIDFLIALNALGDGTYHEIEEEGLIPYQSVSPRGKSLVKKGLIQNTGFTRKYPLTGKRQIVWELTDFGKAFVNQK